MFLVLIFKEVSRESRETQLHIGDVIGQKHFQKMWKTKVDFFLNGLRQCCLIHLVFRLEGLYEYAPPELSVIYPAGSTWEMGSCLHTHTVYPS